MSEEEIQDQVEPIQPDVISPDGRSLYPLDTAPSQALVIHCGDPRFQTAFRRFITEELGIKAYTPLIIGGGLHAFGMQSFLPKNFKILWEQIKFFVKEGHLKRVIIINHEDCRWYGKMKGYHPSVALPLKGQLDLRTAASLILRDFAGVSVESYWAGLDGEHIYFKPVTKN
jgi:hypothetical protein